MTETTVLVFTPDYQIKEFVYLKTDAEQRLMMITGYLIGIHGNLDQYRLECGNQVFWTYEDNICREKTYFK